MVIFVDDYTSPSTAKHFPEFFIKNLINLVKGQ